MLNDLLITEADIQKIIPLTKGVDPDRLTSAIFQAQRIYVRSAIGRALYRDLHTNQTDAKYINLLDGTSYDYQGETIDFYGLKIAIAYYAYAIFVNENNLRATRTGNKVKNSEVSDQATPEMIAREYQRSLDEGRQYMMEVFQFLNENRSTYPLQELRTEATGGFRTTAITQPEYGRGADIRDYRRENFDGWAR